MSALGDAVADTAKLLDAGGVAPGGVAAGLLVAPARVGAPGDPDGEGLARLAAWLRDTAARIDALGT